MLIYLFLYLPLFVVLIFSFSPTKSISGISGFTFDWYRKLFSDHELLISLLHSLEVSVIAVSIAVVLGTFGAFFLDRVNFPAKGTFRTMCQLPLTLPGIIIGLALLILFINFKELSYTWN